jgi:hypothetical protein
MSLDVFFQQDIRNTLVALRAAQSAQPDCVGVVEASVQRERAAYRAGFEMAIRSVALAFGVAVEERSASAACRSPLWPEPGGSTTWTVVDRPALREGRAA